MPAFTVTIAGKTYYVEIPNPGTNPVQVIVDDESFEVDIAGVVSGPASAQGAPAVSSPAANPPTLRSEPATMRQPTASTPAPAGERAPAGRRSTAASGRPAAPGEGGLVVKAPMPGVLLSLDVRPGQHVERGQVVCVLEAMKMKNPIRTTRAGTVSEVLASQGDTVAFNDPLLRVD